MASDIMAQAGKGPRLHANVSNRKYREGWDRIFGKKPAKIRQPKKKYAQPSIQVFQFQNERDIVDDLVVFRGKEPFGRRFSVSADPNRLTPWFSRAIWHREEMHSVTFQPVALEVVAERWPLALNPPPMNETLTPYKSNE